MLVRLLGPHLMAAHVAHAVVGLFLHFVVGGFQRLFHSETRLVPGHPRPAHRWEHHLRGALPKVHLSGLGSYAGATFGDVEA